MSTALATRDHSLAPAPPVPVLTVVDVDRIGAESVANLAALVFRASHHQYPQYDGFLDRQENVRLVRITHDPSAALNTFSRFEPGDVLLAWDPVSGGPGEAVAFCPRVGWNVCLIPSAYEEM